MEIKFCNYSVNITFGKTNLKKKKIINTEIEREREREKERKREREKEQKKDN